MLKILKNIIEMDDYSVQKLSKSQPPEPFEWNTVEGTELNVSDCIGGKGKIEVKGNTEQKQLSGKNLFGISDYEKTYNGVQIKIKDGEITLNGTCTGTGTVYIGPKDEQILNGTYTISRNSISGTMSGSGNINLRNVSDDSIISGTQMSLTINSRTFTLENANVEYGIYLMRDATFDNYKFRPQLVEGDTPDYDFEPYCGGQAAPNPEYPQEVKTVTGNNVVKHFGINLFDFISNLNTEIAGLTISSDKAGNIIVNGTPQRNLVTIVQKVNITDLLEDGQTYTLWQENIESNGGRPWFYVQVGYGENTASNYYSVTTASNMLKFTVDKSQNNIYQIMVQTGNNLVNYNNVKNRFMLLKGDYTNKEVVYEPYREEEYHLDLWKENEFDINDVNKLNAYIDSSNKITSSEATRTLYVECKNNTLYKISKAKSARFRAMYTTDIPAINRVGNGYIVNDAGEEIIIKTGNNAKYLCVFYYHANQDTLTEQEILESIQIQEAIELCKIGDYSDILFKNVTGDENYNAELEAGAWYKKEKVSKIKLENYTINKYQNQSYYTPVSGIPNILNKDFVPLCTHFSGYDKIRYTASTDHLGVIAGDEFMNTYSTVKLFKQFLRDNNVDTYILINPVDKKITDTTLISQLEALRKFKWFKGVNHIWTETDNLEPVLEGTYKQSIQSETQNSIANLQVQANEQNISNAPDLVESEV